MTQGSKSSVPIRTAITATLSVRRGRDAIVFYESALGARVLHRVDDESGAVVAQLSVSGAEFWVADESPEHQNFSPMSLGGCSVRMLLIVDDPDEVCRMALAAGASQVAEVAEGHGWRIGRIVDPFGHHWEIARPVSHRWTEWPGRVVELIGCGIPGPCVGCGIVTRRCAWYRRQRTRDDAVLRCPRRADPGAPGPLA